MRVLRRRLDAHRSIDVIYGRETAATAEAATALQYTTLTTAYGVSLFT